MSSLQSRLLTVLSRLQMFVELHEEECKVMISSCQIVDIATVSLHSISIQKKYFSHFFNY
jgi:hypothetical protein